METGTPSGRRPRRQYPHAAQTPKVLHLPRRSSARRKSSRSAVFPKAPDRLLSLETETSSPIVELNREDDKWRVEADMLRAECGLLRMEKEVASRKMEKKRTKMERTLRTVIRTLISGRDRISQGSDVRMVLDEEINYLVDKLQKLKPFPGTNDKETQNCGNFDRQTLMLRKKLEKFDRMWPKEIRELAEASFSMKPSDGADDDSEKSLARGFLSDKRMQDHLWMIPRAGSLLPASASTSKNEVKTHFLPHDDDFPQGANSLEDGGCSGRCREIAREIVEQFRVEAKQWSQLQEILGQVREEMEDLQASRDSWQDRALDSASRIQSLESTVQEWRDKAISSEAKVKELQEQVVQLTRVLRRLEAELNSAHKSESKTQKTSSQHNKEPQTDTILGILVRRLKENRQASDGGSKQVVKGPNREGREGKSHKLYPGESSVSKVSPLRDIGNLSLRLRQSRRTESSPQHKNKENKV